MNPREWFATWKSAIPDGKPFRVSAKMKTGKYQYVNFVNAEQFKNWLTRNQNRIYSIISVG